MFGHFSHNDVFNIFKNSFSDFSHRALKLDALRCSVKKLFRKILEFPQEDTCGGVPFLQRYWKNASSQVFSVSFNIFFRTDILQNTCGLQLSERINEVTLVCIFGEICTEKSWHGSIFFIS